MVKAYCHLDHVVAG